MHDVLRPLRRWLPPQQTRSLWSPKSPHRSQGRVVRYQKTVVLLMMLSRGVGGEKRTTRPKACQ